MQAKYEGVIPAATRRVDGSATVLAGTKVAWYATAEEVRADVVSVMSNVNVTSEYDVVSEAAETIGKMLTMRCTETPTLPVGSVQEYLIMYCPGMVKKARKFPEELVAVTKDVTSPK